MKELPIRLPSLLFGGVVFFVLLGGIWAFGTESPLPFLSRGLLFFLLFVLWAAVPALRVQKAKAKAGHWGWLQAPKTHQGCITAAMVLGFVLRLLAIQRLPVQPESDFRTYYEVAELLSRGALVQEGSGYCDYIALFPHVIGYPFVLSLLFRITGANLGAGLLLNVLVQVACIYLVARLAQRLCGKMAGILAAWLLAVWPSIILFGTQLASEPLFACLLLLCLNVFLQCTEHVSAKGFVLSSALGFGGLGVLLALASAVRPMGVILLVAMLLCMPPVFRAPAEQKIAARACGWLSVFLLLAGYLLTSRIVSGAVAATIHRELAGAGSSFGYSLLVGLNIGSRGTWNQEDSALLQQVFQQTGSAARAHQACRDMAFLRIRQQGAATLNLMVEKLALLFQNDAFGVEWNRVFLQQQQKLTPVLATRLSDAQRGGTVYYLALLFLAGVSGRQSWQRQGNPQTVLLHYVFLGTAAAHMVVESQNRYQYQLIPILAVLAAYSLATYRKADVNLVQPPLPQQPASQLPPSAAPEPPPFDMQKAIQEGHIQITATPAYLPHAEEQSNEAEEK